MFIIFALIAYGTEADPFWVWLFLIAALIEN